MSRIVKISVSQARAQLSQLLKKLHENPDLVYQITINNMTTAQLTAAANVPERKNPGAALLRASARAAKYKKQKSRRTHNVSAHHNDYLYGDVKRQPGRQSEQKKKTD